MKKLNINQLTNSHTSRKPLGRFLAGALLASTMGCAATPVFVQRPAAISTHVAEQKKKTISDEEIIKLFEPVIKIWLSDGPVEDRVEKGFLEFEKVVSNVEKLEGEARFKFIGVAAEIGDLIKISMIYSDGFKSQQVVEGRYSEAIKDMLRAAYKSDDMASNLERFHAEGDTVEEDIKKGRNIQKLDYVVNIIIDKFRRNQMAIAELPKLGEENFPYARIINAFFTIYGEINSDKSIVGLHFPEIIIDNKNPYAEPGFISLTPQFERPVIINIWGYYCPLCQYEMTGLEAIHETGMATVIGIHVKLTGDRDWRQALGITVPPVTYRLGYMPMEVLDFIPVRILPFTIVIDRFGVVRHQLIGAHEADDIIERVRELSKEKIL